MATLQVRLSDLITAIGTDIKLLRTYITGSSTGDLTGLTTTVKTSVVAAINEVKAGNSGAPPAASETVSGVAELATQVETDAGTDDLRIVTPLKFQTRMAAYSQPLDADLTAVAAVTTVAYGRAFLALANQAGLMALIQSTSTAVQGIVQLATQGEVNTGTDAVKAVTPLTFQTRMAAFAQPLSTNLTNLAGVANTVYGRALLALADQSALMGLIAAGSTTVQGIVSIATQAEVNTGTDALKVVTPVTMQTRMAAFALPLSYLDTDTALAANSNAKVPSQAAVKAYADARIAAADAFVAKGVLDCSTNPNYPAANSGDTYRVSVAGKVGGASGPNVEIGDMIMCFVDATASGTQVAVGANWDIIQTNIDGAVVGPASSVTTDLVAFSGTSGKVVADSGVAISTDGTLATNNNTKVPTEGAIRTYTAANYYTQTQLGNPDTDLVALYSTAKA